MFSCGFATHVGALGKPCLLLWVASDEHSFEKSHGPMRFKTRFLYVFVALAKST